MQLITHLFSDAFTQALGWTILHSLWLGCLWVLLALGAIRIWGKEKPSHRYAIYCTAMLCLFFSVLATFNIQYEIGLIETAMVTPSNEGAVLIEFINYAPQYLQEESTTALLSGFMPIVVTIWLIGMLVFSIRLLGGWIYVRQLRQRAMHSVPPQWHKLLHQMSNRLGISHSIGLAFSHKLSSPILLGYFKPMILLPIGTLNTLSTEEVEAIIAHELAHIYRHDYLVNCCQSVMEVLFYYHPAMWWLSARIRDEREQCCDEVAIGLCGGNRLAYAKALLRLQEWVGTQRQARLALAFGHRKQLLQRITHIIQSPQKNTWQMEKIWIILALFGISLLYLPTAHAHWEEQQQTTELEVEATFATDSIIPQQESKTIIKSIEDGKTIDVVKKNGKIESVKVDGEEVPASEYSAYEDLPALQENVIQLKANQIRVFPESSEEDVRVYYDSVLLHYSKQPNSIAKQNIFRFEQEFDGDFSGNEIILRNYFNNFPQQTQELEMRNNFAFWYSDSIPKKKRIEIIVEEEDFEDIELQLEQIEDMVEDIDIQIWEDGVDEAKRIIQRIEMKDLKELQKHKEMIEKELRLGLGELDGIILKDSLLASLKEAHKLRGNMKIRILEDDEDVELRFAAPNSQKKVYRFNNNQRLTPAPFPKGESFAWVERDGSFGLGTNRNNNVLSRVGSMLKRDNLISSTDDFKFYLSDKKMKVNGKRMPEALHEKYANALSSYLDQNDTPVIDIEIKPGSESIRLETD